MASRPIISVFFTAASLLALWSCAADPSQEPDDAPYSKIFFSSTADNSFDKDASSDNNGVTTTMNIQDFKVTATTPGQWNTIVLLENVTVRRTGINSWTYSPMIEWPETPVTFYMVNPVDIGWQVQTWDKGAMIYQYANSGKTDLITAANYDMMPQSGPVKVNFRHTLSRVTAELRTSIPKEYEVRLKLVYIDGVGFVAHYRWPSTSTGSHNSLDIGSPEVSGEWSIQGWSTNGMETFTIFKSDNSAGIKLNPSDTDYILLQNSAIQFMIPEKLKPSTFEGANWQGANIIVAYSVHRVSDGVRVWPTNETPFKYIYHKDGTRDWAVVPFALADATPQGEWLAGLSYHYRLTLNIPWDSVYDNPTRGINPATIEASCNPF